MAKPTKRRIEPSTDAKAPATTSRTTPKGGGPKGGGQAAPSRRYTPPTPNTAQMPSPLWVPVLMFTFFGAGFLAIFLNYTEILPGAPSGWWLIGGLGAILAGIITATQLR
ncbi:MAG TPA: hypothetical protein VJM33_14065 [Microthrixaceae bacterium]|nr:hypothetical protein [Microthrixaceae bacterium]